MTKLPSVSGRQCRAALEKAGFYETLPERGDL